MAIMHFHVVTVNSFQQKALGELDAFKYYIKCLRFANLFHDILCVTGKSCLMNRFVSNKFDSQSYHTIGVEFLNKEITVGRTTVTLQVCYQCFIDLKLLPHIQRGAKCYQLHCQGLLIMDKYTCTWMSWQTIMMSIHVYVNYLLYNQATYQLMTN